MEVSKNLCTFVAINNKSTQKKMNEKVNIAELLKDCPDGMELDCTMFEKPVKYIGLTNSGTYVITIKTSLGKVFYLTKDGRLHDMDDAKCIIFPKGKTTWDGFVPPCEFKDGEFLAYHSIVGTIICIHRNKKDERTYKTSFYVGLNGCGKLLVYDKYTLFALNRGADTCLATEEEKEKLLQAIKDNGYNWNPDTKTLEKLVEPKFKVGDRVRHKTTNKDDVYEISKVYDDSYGLVGYTWMIYMKYQDDYELVPKKFDITTLKPFESKVLVRDDGYSIWQPSIWGIYDKGHRFPYITTGVRHRQCIPYKGNEHLLGKTDHCDEYYKNW